MAHAIAELKLRKQWVEPMGARKFNAALKKLQANDLYQPEMLTCADAYLDYINAVAHSYDSPPHIAAELKLDFGHIVPEGFGTGDCVIVGGHDLYIIDYKHGKGVPVSAEDNPQMRLYALGALERYKGWYDLRTVHMAIVQPRIDNTNDTKMSVEDLVAWGESIKPVAQAAYNGQGECAQGDWCRFCRAKAQCRTRAEHYIDLTNMNRTDPKLLRPEEIARALSVGQDLDKWLSDVKDYALAECLAGRSIPGYKAVAGRSVRRFTDTDEALARLQTLAPEEMLYEHRPLSLAALEKLIGKTEFAQAVGDLVEAPQGKPTLVPESDKREPFRSDATQYFGGMQA